MDKKRCALLVLMLETLLINSVSPTALDITSCDAVAQRGDGVVCYQVVRILNSWSDALQHCTASNEQLLTTLSPAETTAVAGLLTKWSFVDSWLGLVAVSSPWHWLDGTTVSSQGCYADNSTSPDLSVMISLQNNSLTVCTAYCYKLGYSYAGLQNGTGCWCGNSFGTYGQAGANCVIPCPGNITTSCGGISSNIIIATNGSFSNWEPGRPGDSLNDQNCATIDTSSSTYEWVDKPCTQTNWALCQTANTQFNCGANSGTSVQLSNGATCLFIVQQSMTYFNAREACSQAVAGGDLAELKTVSDNEAFASWFRSSSYNTRTSGLWIGLVKTQWFWQSGDTFFYNNWDMSEPTAPGLNCGAVKDNDNNAWSNYDCTSQHYFICQKSNSSSNSLTPIQLPTSSPTSRPASLVTLQAPTVITTAGVTAPGSLGGNSPMSSSSSSTASMSSMSNSELDAIIGGVVGGGGGGLLLIIIIIIIIVCCVKCRRRHEKETRDSKKAATIETPEKSDDVADSYYFEIKSDYVVPPSRKHPRKSTASMGSIDTITDESTMQSTQSLQTVVDIDSDNKQQQQQQPEKQHQQPPDVVPQHVATPNIYENNDRL